MSLRTRSIVVNAITFARVPLIFAWAALAVAHELSPTRNVALAVGACAAMLFSGLTDLWDGKLARRWGVVSTLGKMADPLMDKVFYLVAFPVLTWQVMHQASSAGSSAHGLVVLALTVLYLLRDTWVTFLRSVGTLYGADVAAMWLGKVRTALSFPGAGLIYVYLAFHPYLDGAAAHWALTGCYVVEAVLAALTLWSFYTYTLAYAPYLKMAVEKSA